MKISLKVVLFLTLLSLLFLSALTVLTLFDNYRLRSVKKELLEEKSYILQKTIDLKARTLYIYSFDYSYWDEMLDFVATGDPIWAYENLETTMESFCTDFLWVLDSSLNSVYHYNLTDGINIPSTTLTDVKSIISDKPFNHFFQFYNGQLFEIRTSPIQPSSDIERLTDPQGFFIVGKIWNQCFIDELGSINSSFIIISEPGEKTHDYFSRHHLVNTYQFHDLEENLVAVLESHSDLVVVRNFQNSIRLLLLIMFLFALSIVILIHFFLKIHILQPLKLINAALDQENPVFIDKFISKKDEIGRVSKMICDFFLQKKQLLTEIEKRNNIEKRQNALFKISEATNSTESLSELYKEIHDIIKDLMFADNFYITIFNKDENMLYFPYFVDQYESESLPIKPEKSLTYHVIRTGKPLLVNPKKLKNLVDSGEIIPVGSLSVDWLGVPLIKDNESFGALVVQSYDENARYTQEHLRILTFVSEHISISIRRKYAQEELSQALEETKVAYEKLESTQKELINIEKKNTLLAVSIAANHEINQPLMIMKGYVELLELSISEDLTENQKRYIEGINSSLVRIEKILKELEKVRDPDFVSYVEGVDMIKLSENKDPKI